MTPEPTRRARLLAWIAYRMDRALDWPVAAKASLLLGLVGGVLLAWGTLLRVAYPTDPSARTPADALWWALSIFLDPGTMVTVQPGERLVALGITASGIVSVSFLTGAIAGNVSARLDSMGSGRGPAIERKHLLVLGFDAKVAWIAREYARSRPHGTAVFLSNEPKERVEAALQSVRLSAGRRTGLLVRVGDPQADAELLRVSAPHAEAIVVVAPSSLDDESAARWSLATLLAVRRAVGPDYAGTVVAEVRRASLAPLLALAAEPDVAGPGALRLRVVAEDETIARVLAQSARQEGVYTVLRQLLSSSGSELYAEPVPRELHGATFEDAHARALGAIPVGVRRANAATELNPSPTTPLGPDDALILVSPEVGSLVLGEALAPPSQPPTPRDPSAAAPRERVLLVGFNDTLPFLVRELDHILGAGSTLTVFAPPNVSSADATLQALRPSLRNLQATLETREATQPLSEADGALLESDAVVILGAKEKHDEHGDSSALAYLLWLRHGLRATGRRARRVVTEVRHGRSAASVASNTADVLVSADVVAMLLLRSALQPHTTDAYHELLSAEGHELVVRPREDFLGTRAANFAEVQAAARVRGEIALGLVRLGAVGGVRFNPPRDAPVPHGDEGRVVVLSPAR